MTVDTERAAWLQSLKPGDTVVTITAKSGNRARIEHHKVKADSDEKYIRITNSVWRVNRANTSRSAGEYLLPDDEEVIAAESVLVLRQARIRWMAYKMGAMTDDQLDRIEAIQKERKRKAPPS
ncbi:MAG TPA: hypothetical protein VN519_06410 [Bryobacteraceae bacterium]|nr:hypothetical protein [Bryobacteraceae bacterium]